MRLLIGYFKRVVLMLATLIVLFSVSMIGLVIYRIKNTQNITDDLYLKLNRTNNIGSIFEIDKLSESVCKGYSQLSFRTNGKFLFAKACLDGKRKQRIEGPVPLSKIFPNYEDLLRSSSEVVFTVMTNFPYRGIILVKYDESLNITEVEKPRFYD